MSQPFDPNAVPPPYPGNYPAPMPYQPMPYQQPYQPQPYQQQGFTPPNGYGYPPPAPYAYVPQPLSSAFRSGERSRNRKIAIGVAIGLGALALIGTSVGIVVAAQPSAPARIALPTQFDGYSKLDNANSRTVESTMRASASANPVAEAIYNAASIGVYSHNTGDLPTLITLTLPTSRVPQVASAAPETVVNQLLSQAATPGTATEISAGTHGGDEQCAYATVGAAHETLCAWSDPTTTGMLVSVEQPQVSAVTLGTVNETFRDLVD